MPITAETQRGFDYRNTRPFTPQDWVAPKFKEGPAPFIDEIESLRRVCDRVGIARTEPGKMQNYDFVLARWGFNRCGSEEQRNQFRKNELINIETAMRERNNTETSRQPLFFNTEGKVYNPALGTEAWEDVVQRGIDFRESEGSKDLEREKAEKVGFLKIQKRLYKAGVGAAAAVISSPSDVEKTPYVKNFIDIYMNVQDPDTGEVRIEYTRYASAIAKEAYRGIAEKIKPDYFKEHTTEPEDAYYLGHPLFFDANEKYTHADAIFTQHFEADDKAMKEEEWQRLWQQKYYPFALHLQDAIMEEKFDPLEIAKRLNTLLHSGEDEELIKAVQEHMGETMVFVGPQGTKIDEMVKQQMHAFVSQFGLKEVKETQVGCGSSSGVTINEATANSVAQFGIKNKEGESKKCGTCGKGTHDEHYHCPDCSKEYADETKRQPEDRTKKCNCGFEFGC